MLYNMALCVLIIICMNPAQAETKRGIERLEPISVQLRYLHQFQFAGFYAAIQQGYYKEVVLDVTLIEAKLGQKAVDEVLSGKAQYGQTQTDLLYYRLQGKPLVALAPIFQHSPTVLMVRGDSNIYSPHDLVGKRVMLELGDNAISTLAMLRHEGVQSTDIEIVEQSYGIDELVSGTVDAVGIYLTNRPFLLQQAGVAYRTLNPINYGIDFYGDTLFTTEDEVNDHPQRVERFLKATLRGWQYAMEHPEEIIDLLINQYGVTKSREHLLFEAQAMKKLMLPDLIEIGHMNPGRWQRMADIFVRQGISSGNNSLEGFIYTPKLPWFKQYWIRYLYIVLILLLVANAAFLYFWRFSKRLQKVISERNLAEKDSLRLGHVLEQSSNEIYIFDANSLRFIQVNEGGRRNLSYDMEELEQLTPLDLKPDFTRQTFEKLTKPLTEGKQQQVVFETIHKRKDGSLYPVEVRLQYMEDPEQSIFYAIINDITDRKRIDQELREKNTELERFIYMISHDLKSPLVTVKTFLGYLKKDMNLADSDRIAEDIGFMSTATDKMGLLLEDLLDFSRVGRQAQKPVAIPFKQLMREVSDLTAGHITESNVMLTVDQVNLTLVGDHAQLLQIWQNLVENAVKYMGDQSNPLIEIGVKDHDDGPVFFVRDNGMGIDPRFQDKIFELFEQLNANAEGSGLGLALIKRIVDLYGGTISVESKGPGQGTCFCFTLPKAINDPLETDDGW